MMAQQQGMVLMAALTVLVMLLLMGVSGARLAIQGEHASRGLRDRDVAMQAAEDALADGERELAGGGSDPARMALLSDDSAYVAGCGTGSERPDQGLCLSEDGGSGDPSAAKADEKRTPAAPAPAPAWQTVDLADGSPQSHSVPFGHYTGAGMETGEAFLPFRKPRYVIERLPSPEGGTDHVYRVTAIGFGAKEGVEAVLQSVYRQPAGGGEAAKGERVAWREVSNWRELRSATTKP
jgi:type IV pilus assembly protein PilX